MTTRSLPAHRLSIRALGSRENHHLWNNNGTWWLHFTLLSPDGHPRRIRTSLKTRDVEKARRKRDKVLTSLNHVASRLVA